MLDPEAESDAGPVQVPISALEHWSYCPRQCGLIHLEQTFDDNLFTLRGHAAHERVDSGSPTTERGVRILRAVPLWCDRLGLVGRADALEMHDGVPYPVEYKSGARRRSQHEALQVCAQALCLEEMLGIPVPRGAVSYLASRQRREIAFTPALRAAVERATAEIRVMLGSRDLPPPVNDARCTDCSLIDACLPAPMARPGRLRRLAAELFVVETDAVLDEP